MLSTVSSCFCVAMLLIDERFEFSRLKRMGNIAKLRRQSLLTWCTTGDSQWQM